MQFAAAQWTYDSMALASDGNIWVTGNGTKTMSAFALNGTHTLAISNINGSPTGIVAGHDGLLYATLEYGNAVLQIDPQTKATKYIAVPSQFTWLMGITSGPDGAIWFCEHNMNKIGLIVNGVLAQEFPVSGEPISIAAGNDGAIWFTEAATSGATHQAIGRLTSSGMLQEYPLTSWPGQIASGPDGALWFTEERTGPSSGLGRIGLDGTITEFNLPGQAALGIIVGPDKNLWVGYSSTWGVGSGDFFVQRMTTAGTIVATYRVPTSEQLLAAPDGTVWLSGVEAGVYRMSGF